MIASAFIFIIGNFLKGILSPILLFSDVVLPASMTTALTDFKPYLSIADGFFPIATLGQVLALVLLVEAIIFGYQFVRWVYSKIPGVN